MKGYWVALYKKIDNVQNLKDSTPYKLKNINVYEWSADIHHYFMLKNWGIFHGAYFKEPFGYSILQAVDAGKLPIISKGWCPEFNYPYRASSKEEFENMVKLIQNTNKETRKNIFNSAKEFLKKALGTSPILKTTKDGKGKFGRILGEFIVEVEDNRININQLLVDNYHAVHYQGQSKETIKEQDAPFLI